MFEWLMLFFPVTYAEPPKKDYIGMVAAEVAYSALLPDAPVVKPLVDTKDCKRCGGTGKIRTGDTISWTDCPDCEPKDGAPKGNVKESAPLPSMKLQVKPLPPVKTSDCENGVCPIPRT
jgi:hypothetical protein